MHRMWRRWLVPGGRIGDATMCGTPQIAVGRFVGYWDGHKPYNVGDVVQSRMWLVARRRRAVSGGSGWPHERFAFRGDSRMVASSTHLCGIDLNLYRFYGG